jgi:hypothetical protein
LQSINDNFLYELQDAQLSAVHSDSELADIIVKFIAGESLGPAEQLRLDYFMIREVSMWELAFIRHSEGLMPPAQWTAWESSFFDGTIRYLTKEKWDEWSSGYGEEFSKYVELKYSEQP